MSCFREVSKGVEITVKVVPGASRDRIVGRLGDALKVQVAAPPEKGKANKCVERLVAEALGIKAGRVKVISGLSSPRKTLRVEGETLQSVRSALTPD